MENEKQKFGEPLEDFSLQQIDGPQTTLAELLQGKKGAALVFWSGVCSHCARYDPYFNSFQAKHPELEWIVVASRHGETAEMIRKTAAERKLAFPILHDPGGVIARKWFTQQTPRVFLMDAERRLLYRGAVDNFKYPEDPEYLNYLEPAVEQFVSGAPVVRTETASFGCAIQSVYYILPKAIKNTKNKS